MSLATDLNLVAANLQSALTNANSKITAKGGTASSSISELGNAIENMPSGSNAIIVCTDCGAGATVTATDGTHSYSATADSSGKAFLAVAFIATYTVSSNSAYTTSKQINISELAKSYDVYLRDLPSEYQKLEWIQGTGTQWVQTDYYMTPLSRVVVDQQFTAIETQARFFHAYSADGGSFESYINGNSYWAYSHNDGGGDWKATEVSADTNRHTMDYNGVTGKYIISGTSVDLTMEGAPTMNSTSPLCFLVRTANGAPATIASGAKAKFYSAQVYENGALKHSYVPCYHKITGHVGLYDLIDEKFFANKGSGNFVKGPEIIYEDYIQKVSYIESSRTQYIDSEICPLTSSGFSVEASAAYIGTSAPNPYHCLYGVVFKVDSSTNFYIQADKQSTAQQFRYLQGTGGTDVYFTYADYANRHTWKSINNSLYIDDILQATSPESTFMDSPYPLYLFARNNQIGGDIQYGSWRVYSFKITNAGTLVRDFVPAYIIRTGEIGLFDKVSNMFFTNSGSGTFAKGADITEVNENA